MTMSFAWASMPTIAALDELGAHLLKSLRLVGMISRNAPDAGARLLDHWGDASAVRRFLLAAHSIGAVWPEPIAICPPCCGMMTHDEQLLLSLFDAALGCDRPRFDAHAQDLLDQSARDHLYVAMRHLVIQGAFPPA